MASKKTRAQSIIEYVALVLFISGAVSAMYFYIQRTIEVRQRHLNEELNEASRGFGQI
jgi:F0F1-type ATP synthase membrane subunit b/b'